MTTETVANDDIQTTDTPVAADSGKKPLNPVNGLVKKIDGDLFDEWERIGSSSFTVGFLVESLRSNDPEFIQKHGKSPIEKVTARDISQGKGFASIVYKAVIYFAGSKESEAYSTIMKVPGGESFETSFEPGSGMDKNTDLIDKVIQAHEFECQFYNEVASFVEVPVPKVYKTISVKGGAEGLIHMQDFSDRAKTSSMYDSFTASQIMSITKHLAKMHKNALRRSDWHGKYLDNQTIFVSMTKMLEQAIDSCLKMCADQENTKLLIEHYRKIFLNPDYIVYAMRDSWKDLKIPPVLVHGDMWGGNILWLTDEFDLATSTVGAFVDWQIMHEGSIMADLARVMICTDGDTRRTLERTIFDFYHEELTNNFKADGLECPVTLDQIKKAYPYIFITQAAILPMLVTFVQSLKNDDDPDVTKSRVDRILLKVKHGMEDVDKYAKGELKWVFDKYNV